MLPVRKFLLLFAGLVSVIAAFCGQALAQPLQHYDLSVGDKKVGTVVLTSQDLPGDGRKLGQQLRIKTAGFWGKLDVQENLEETLSAAGKLQEANNTLKENGKVYWSRLSLSGTEYLSFRARMKDDGEKDLDDLAGLAKGVVTILVPEVGDVIEIGTLLLSDGKNAPKHDRLTQTSFDTSLLGLPFYWQRNGFRLPADLKVLDTQDMVILKTRVEDLGTVALPLGGQWISARHYRLGAKGMDPIEIWLYRAEDGRAHFAQLTGKEDGNTYLVRLRPRIP